VELTPQESACLVGRTWLPEFQGPSIVAVLKGEVLDITSREAPTMRDLLELDDPVDYVASARGKAVGPLSDLAVHAPGPDVPHLLAPCDLQAVKACGVTFARSMIERVIEERAAGDPARAEAIRVQIGALIGSSLRDLQAGSEKAAEVKSALLDAGLWSQYLEVGIGPDAEVFTKAQPMSSVGWGAKVGVHPVSSWNNPEPEVVLACDSRGRVKGATLGNDVNLRDVEGRSALLLGKAKDNNASCAIGPFIRLFDGGFGIDNVRSAQLELLVEGTDGYRLEGRSDMAEISRDPLDLVAQTCGPHHQYPDGFVLFLGTLFSPTEDRNAPGEGFTHKLGDTVTIHSREIGTLVNTVDHSPDCPPWTFGTAALMRNLAARRLI
jgi:fumarylacetoacetate (FAA) hydrolase family protein